jgi:hypothetical protein
MRVARGQERGGIQAIRGIFPCLFRLYSLECWREKRYCPLRGMEEKSSPSGEDFSMPRWGEKAEYPPPEGGGFERPCKLPPPEGGGS